MVTTRVRTAFACRPDGDWHRTRGISCRLEGCRRKKARGWGAISTETGVRLTDEEIDAMRRDELARRFARSRHRYGETYQLLILNRQKMTIYRCGS